MNNDLKLLQRNFNAAAQEYLEHAKIQREPALFISQILSLIYSTGMILDLGSGPGTLSYQVDNSFNNVIHYDLSINMLKSTPNKWRINGNANNLPIRELSLDGVISNLMLQWIENKSEVFKEIARVLKSAGHVIISTLIQPSLYELQNAWQEVDNLQHTLIFDNLEQYQHLITTNQQFSSHKYLHWNHTFYFNDIYSLMHHFKDTGTSMTKSNISSGLGGRASLTKLANAYEKLRTSKGLPLTYSYLIIIARKI